MTAGINCLICFSCVLQKTITNPTGAKVAFGTTTTSGGVSITYDFTNRTFTLPAGKTYRIDFDVGWIHFNTGAFLRLALYNDTTNTKISAVAHCEAVSSGAFAGTLSFFHIVTVGSSPLVISVKTTTGSSPINATLGDTEVGPTISIQSID
ncbi:MAG: hypothetical protein ABI793_08405 [Flavobacterium sp.]